MVHIGQSAAAFDTILNKIKTGIRDWKKEIAWISRLCKGRKIKR